MSTVTIEAIRPVVINHYLLYPGERREVTRDLAAQLVAGGHVRLIGPPLPTSVEPASDAPDPKPSPTRKGRKT